MQTMSKIGSHLDSVRMEGSITEKIAVETTSVENQPISGLVKGVEPFSEKTFEDFNIWIEGECTKEKSSVSRQKLETIKKWLDNPTLKAAGQKERNEKYQIFHNYELVENKVYRKVAGNAYLEVMSADEVGKVIARHHCNLQHVGIHKTLEYVQRIYYGITKEHVKKLLAECVIC